MQEKRWLESDAFFGSVMVDTISAPQERILRWLGGFSPTMEKAWDVTRDLSLPGISEALGVVRSALNSPLSKLEEEDLVFKRKAHVIGGGSRRRHVYHLTDEGRQLLEGLGEEATNEASNKGALHGTAPQLGHTHGRQQFAEEVAEQMREQHCLILSGLPGIGKTTVGGLVSEHLLNSGINVRWAQVDKFTDAQALCRHWGFKGPLPNDEHALAEYVAKKCKKDALVIDDAHLIDERHLASIQSLCGLLDEAKATHMLVIGREPLWFPGVPLRIAVPALDAKDAALLLGQSTDETTRIHIAESLGGHPLAIMLHEEGTPLPEAGADIQSYVENVVLSTLDASMRSGLDHLVMVPMPIEAAKAFDSDVVGNLDDYAFLRWTSGLEKMEVQHLVRNVRRSAFDEETLQQLHKAAVIHWQKVAETQDDQVILLYHRIASLDDGLEAQLEGEMDRLLGTHSGAFSVLLEQAIKVSVNPSHLHYLAGKIALERCEHNHARRHLDFIEDAAESRHIALGLAMLEGRVSDAEELIEVGLNSAIQGDANKMALAAASSRIDDRVFGQEDATLGHDVKHYLSKVDLSGEAPDKRSVVLVAMSMIQHALALYEGEFTKAQRMRESLAGISGLNEPLVQEMEAKAQLVAAKSAEERSIAIQAMKAAIEIQTNPVRADALQLSLIEHLIEHEPGEGKELLRTLPKPPIVANSATQHRLNARWWTCTSKAQPSLRRIALREAIAQHRAAGCPRAAKVLETQLHLLL